jgi:hypothetical protein
MSLFASSMRLLRADRKWLTSSETSRKQYAEDIEDINTALRIQANHIIQGRY